MALGTSSRRPDSVEITPRRIVIDYGPLVQPPEDWYAGDAAVSEVFHALSATFPAGEAFFMDSVRHFEGQLRHQHPALWGDVVLFLKQEALHSAQHEKWNRRIEVVPPPFVETESPSSALPAADSPSL
jgi:predicted metal-dependent hydrolase